MTKKPAAFLLVLVASVMAAGGPPDPTAEAVVDRMMEAMGGEAKWDNARFLRFDWVVERASQPPLTVRHLWDRAEGHYRVEWQTREGRKVVALFNVTIRTGSVYVNGQPARDEDLQKYLDQAYGRFINDSYWLLMPWKLKDFGVKLDYLGKTELDGQAYDLLHVSFQGVGLTPGDQYWAYINRRTRLMDRWAYFLESYEGEPALEKATPWNWLKWDTVGGGIRLAREKVRIGEEMRIHFPVLAVLKQVEPGVFTSLEAPLPDGAPVPSGDR